MKQYYGIFSVIFGSLILILSYLFDWVDYNFVQYIATLFVIGGIVAHIMLNKKESKSPEA